jgi:hypothetical protein
MTVVDDASLLPFEVVRIPRAKSAQKESVDDASGKKKDTEHLYEGDTMEKKIKKNTLKGNKLVFCWNDDHLHPLIPYSQSLKVAISF